MFNSFNIFRKFNLSSLLVALLPLGYYIKGGETKGITDITLMIFLCFHIYTLYLLVIKGQKLLLTIVDFLLFSWILIITVSIFYTPYQSNAIMDVAKYCLFSVPIVVFSRLFINTEEKFYQTINLFLFISFLVSSIVMIDFYLKGAPIGRYKFLSVHPVPLSMLGAINVSLLIILFLEKKIKLLKFFLYTTFGSAILIIAGSKGPVLSLAILFILLSPYLVKKIKLKRLIQLVIIIIGFSIILPLTPVAGNVDNLLNRFSKSTDDQSTYDRLYLYDEAIKSFSESPVVGKGIASFKNNAYPHNIFLEILSENGVILLLVFSGILTYILSYYIRSVFFLKETTNIISLTITLLSLINLLYSWTYTDNKFLYFGLGLMLSVQLGKEKSKL